MIEAGVAPRDELRESLYWLVARIVAGGYRADSGLAGRRRPLTARDHAELVESVRATTRP